MKHQLPLMVSNSEIQVWKDCRRRWYLSYYRELGLATQAVMGPRALGTKVHVALCQYYESGRNPVETVIELYQEDERNLILSGQEYLVTDLRKELDLAKAMLEGYVEWASEIGVDAEYEMISSEEVLTVPSGVPEIHLRGKLDQRMVRRSDGRRLFRDFKTVQSIDQARSMLYMDEQMRFYHLLEQLHAAYLARTQVEVEEINKEAGTNGQPKIWRTDGALYLMLRKVKRTARANPPFYEQAETGHNREIIITTWQEVHTWLMEILKAHQGLDAGGDHRFVTPARRTRDCTWKCDFFKICPMFDDGSNVDGAIAEHYVHVNPHERYDVEDQKKGND